MNIENRLNTHVKPTVEEQMAKQIRENGEFTTVDKEKININKHEADANIAPLDFDDER